MFQLHDIMHVKSFVCTRIHENIHTNTPKPTTFSCANNVNYSEKKIITKLCELKYYASRQQSYTQQYVPVFRYDNIVRIIILLISILNIKAKLIYKSMKVEGKKNTE